MTSFAIIVDDMFLNLDAKVFQLLVKCFISVIPSRNAAVAQATDY